ncbi:helix-turn-helix domain-containing protein [Ferruginibacter albus]|uniref:helix-turn-helix domain-containing protein n=1 Tax=Ferruginibacter albus TaxID=2875540 RepID=UPI001CC365AC|nr:helix-turn-helix transcriptional regulator [Ferruginibacter albus]UAY51547.1 helix-turn-helix domain-containing protein [Ferruginibacter albus]
MTAEHTLLITLGLRIKNIRKDKNMTQSALSHKCGFPKGTLSRIEKGKTNLTIRSLWKICSALETEMGELFTNL